MPRDRYIPDHKEPHIHVHRGGVTFTDVGHNHRTLKRGNLVYYGVRTEVLDDLRGRGDARASTIADWIRDNV